VFSPFSSPPTPYTVAVSLQATYRNEDEEEDEFAHRTTTIASEPQSGMKSNPVTSNSDEGDGIATVQGSTKNASTPTFQPIQLYILSEQTN
jgi:hypothetical protein